MLRGDVWWADLGPARGSAPAFHRPALVISADSFNRSAIRTGIRLVLGL
ncbi:MAG: type II toxin-antitoxin system PemK/MazF family toxin [Candidatus Dormibacteraeota bacterium]|nr:type II toxin-antitoxin system PemK/MazF family toxin [Candidatus Dormibacteraeota bacterium]